ncbi:hypothetical protein JQN72_06855 [Phycicoccus sp. CSK15P-2]|uniref:hypothetical protein n=1 Tax=Phycicoccus sp. CSK15P-2 TaxID=2807627 RepID=UPI00194EBD29|nr:hypothetical protein [Phycicoccus sp. CSK15P-2]MBM6403959.1 hypothetical protein [Phycicoccus sp. CSK15P-2]
MTDRPSHGPLLPGLADRPDLDRALRRSLETLRDAADPPVADRLRAVLEGRASLRDVAREGAVGSFVGPLADAGWERYEQMSDTEIEEARRTVEGGPDTSETPPAPPGPGGTW